jgi:hypothetical protein
MAPNPRCYSGRAERVALQGVDNVALECQRGQRIRRRNLFIFQLRKDTTCRRIGKGKGIGHRRRRVEQRQKKRGSPVKWACVGNVEVEEIEWEYVCAGLERSCRIKFRSPETVWKGTTANDKARKQGTRGGRRWYTLLVYRMASARQ